ncbi:MAG: class I tRNA ligase family protein, partial [Nitrososphaerales archaeon]|nr:class I tRNA ligase family protein [Nitrososphaerales archaeon]
MKPIVIIQSRGLEGIPAYEVIKREGIKNQKDPKLEKATQELYAHEFHLGKMMDNTGEYAGLTVAEAREKVKLDMIKMNKADTMYEILNQPVVCRCGAECVVKIFENQWFLNYDDPEWKKLTHECLNRMSLLPDEIRSEFEYTIDWLKKKACARKSGLGTRLPWDRDWVIESLSDSVIYMAYYTIAKYINQNKISADKLTDEFFDYVFLGDTRGIHKINLDPSLLEDMRREFTYFYPLDSRHSGRDLVPNHLTFFIFNHVAIFPKDHWPRQIVVNGSVLMEGKKMSKSFGNIVPLRDAVRDYGADPLRLAIIGTAELLADADFSFELVKTFRERLQRLYELALELSRSPVKEVSEGELKV